MAKNVPTVMISSTYYDLRQVRKDLVSFIENDLGYDALASEFDSFPVDPDADTIENCRRRVEREADILVLIIGGRYGFIDKKRNQSVTNLEYLTARAKGIPIYAFVDKGVLPLLAVWEKNPKAKYAPTVTDTRVFEFIRQVRTMDSVWTYEFEHAQDIVNALRKQFAHTLNEGLKLMQRISVKKDDVPADISSKALKIVLEEPPFWEHYLFGQVLVDETQKYASLREDHRFKLMFSIGENITKNDVLDWILSRNEELRRLVSTSSEMLKLRLPEALNPEGVPANSKQIVWVAKKLIEVYFHALNWSQRVRHVHTTASLRPIFVEMTNFPDDLIVKLETFGPRLLSELDSIQLLPKGVPKVISITLTPEINAGPHFNDLMEECYMRSLRED